MLLTREAGNFPLDVPNCRLLQWRPGDGRVTVAIDGTCFMNGNALGADGRLVHCEHGRRCIGRSGADGAVEPIVTHFEGKRPNSPNDVTVVADGAIWFTDPAFGLPMPNQGSLAEPDLGHRSVYRFDPASRELGRMANFEQPNGLFFSRMAARSTCPTRRFRSPRCPDRKPAARTPLGYIPAPSVCSNCAFGGPGMKRLFIAATT